MNSFRLDIITPTRSAFSQEVEHLLVPTPAGYIEVLAHHVALFSALSEGELKITAGNKQYFLAIGGGFMEVTKGMVSVLVSRAAHADELNEAEIKKAQQEAKEALTKYKKGIERAQAQTILRRSLLELKVSRHRRSISIS